MKLNDTQNSLKLASLGVLLSATISLGLITVLDASMQSPETEIDLDTTEPKLSAFYCGNE
tara:strand:- start:166 stop:345 length:180 start_codon:yes stop_codon:yes gene_type:complete